MILQKFSSLLFSLKLVSQLKGTISFYKEKVGLLPDFDDFEHICLTFTTLNFYTNPDLWNSLASLREELFLNILVMNKLVHEIFILSNKNLAKTALVVITNFTFFVRKNKVVT